MAEVRTLKNVLEEFNGHFSSHVLSDVTEIGQDKSDKEYRQGADAIVVDLNWEEQRYIGKKLHSIFFEPDTDLEGMKHKLRKFCEEIVLISGLKHENIISFIGVYKYDHCDEADRPIGKLPMLVMERVPFSLTQYIDTFKSISEADVVNVLCDIARGLVYLHEIKVVHCDLSSNNILLTFNFRAKVADFGSALKLRGQDGVVMQPAAGTPAFMPPEVLMDHPFYTVSVDVFSFGCIIIHMIACKWPTPTGEMLEASELERRQHLIDLMRDSFLISIVKACLDVKEKRPTCQDLLDDLSKMQNTEGEG